MIFKYLSIWIWILVILHRYTSNTFNLIFLTLFVCIGGAYVSFVNPKYYLFKFGSIKIKTEHLIKLLTIEVVFHFMLLMFVFTYYGNKYTLFSHQTLNSILLLIVYYFLINVQQMYHIQEKDILIITLVFIIILSLFHYIT